MSDRVYLQARDLDRLGELVLELAQQLHVERARRIALERALEAQGALAPGAVERAAASPACRDAARAELDKALERLLRIVTAGGGPATPLR